MYSKYQSVWHDTIICLGYNYALKPTRLWFPFEVDKEQNNKIIYIHVIINIFKNSPQYCYKLSSSREDRYFGILKNLHHGYKVFISVGIVDKFVTY